MPQHFLNRLPLVFPSAVISTVIETESPAELKKLNDALETLKQQDPTLQGISGDTRQTLINGTSEQHLEGIKNRLLREFGLAVKFHKPQVNYCEVVTDAAETVLFEPVMKLTIETPADYHGDFIGDLQRRRASIAKTVQHDKMITIEAHVPLKELLGYSHVVFNLGQGQARCEMELLSYAPAPPEPPGFG